jgi:Gas vesicle protein
MPSGLADVVGIVLDKGIVIDAYVRVSLVGIELLTIDARIVVASVETPTCVSRRRPTGWTCGTKAAAASPKCSPRRHKAW